MFGRFSGNALLGLFGQGATKFLAHLTDPDGLFPETRTTSLNRGALCSVTSHARSAYKFA